MSADSHTRNLRVALACAGVVLLADRLSKDWVWANLRNQAPRPVIKGVVHLDFAFNTGSAFGLAAGQPWARAVFSLFAVSVVLMLFTALWRIRPRNVMAALGVGFSAGGAAGNLLCRLTRVHEVRFYRLEDADFSDFIQFAPQVADAFTSRPVMIDVPRRGVVDFLVLFIGPHRRWPAFNLADIALTVGAICLILWVWREDEDVFTPDDARPPSGG
jgi:signal peptidase II